MRIVVNQLAALGVRTGIGHYTDMLIRTLRTRARNSTIDAFPTGLLRHARQAGSRLRNYLTPPTAAATSNGTQKRSWSVKEQCVHQLRAVGRVILGRQFRSLCRREQFDLYHEPNFIPLESDCRTVTTVHDLSVLRHPEWHPADRIEFFERQFASALNRSEHFITISEFTRQEMIRHLGIAEHRVTSVHLAARPGLRRMPADETQAALKELGLPPRFLLYLGTLEPRKNILMALRAYCSLPGSVRERWPFVLVGGWGWRAAEIAQFLDEEARSKNVIHLGYLNDEYMAHVYSGARALVFPSHYEGFGLPPVEMMACGGAVLASRADALVETVGSKAYLLDPLDFDGWRTAIQRVLTDDDWLGQLRAGTVEAAARFTWERCADETLGVYRKLLHAAPTLQFTKATAQRKAG